ncbi:hypothetical protein HK405_009273, partial [Cladochytrium tenue]
MQRVAVLGGGVSGLAAAWHLARAPASAAREIIVLEASPRFGGWLHSVRSDRGDLFELGPRTLRPAGDPGTATLAMVRARGPRVHELGLANEVMTASKTSPAARNRLILHRGELNLLPSTLGSLLFRRPPPVLDGAVTGFLREPFVPRRRAAVALDNDQYDDDDDDESVHDFVARRFSPAIAENVVSAVLRGIYAGDARKLSARSAAAGLWNLEKKHGSILRGMLAAKPAVSTV